MAGWGRRLAVAVLGSPTAVAAARRCGWRPVVRRFVAGPEAADAVDAVRRLRALGRDATVNYLGEGTRRPEAAQAAASTYVALVATLEAAAVGASLSVKPTQLGLAVDPALCRACLRRVLEAAAAARRFLRLDMEGSAYTDATIELFAEAARAGLPVGLTLQACLRRTPDDLARVQRLGANVRLVKGAYAEPPAIALRARAEVDAALVCLIERHLLAGCYTAVATHDARVIAHVQRFVRARGIPRDRFEFQMLYGVREGLQRQVVAAGHRLRVYVPFGQDWYPYVVRRVAERPAHAVLLLRSLLAPPGGADARAGRLPGERGEGAAPPRT